MLASSSVLASGRFVGSPVVSERSAALTLLSAKRALEAARNKLLPILKARAGDNCSSGSFKPRAANYFAVHSVASPFDKVDVGYSRPVATTHASRLMAKVCKVQLAAEIQRQMGKHPRAKRAGSPLGRSLVSEIIPNECPDTSAWIADQFQVYQKEEMERRRRRLHAQDQAQDSVDVFVAEAPGTVPEDVVVVALTSVQAQENTVVLEDVVDAAAAIVDETIPVPEASPPPRRPRIKKEKKTTEPQRRSARIARQNPRRSARIAARSARS
ncbi:hypothetical protein HKX48_003957 [Thoreauomyces humboldtii]|nr:hypothetical protein HKX48_003957 [Thoreauomyces humboldtii]